MMTASLTREKIASEPGEVRQHLAKVLVAFAGFCAVNLVVFAWIGPARVPLSEATLSISNYTSPMYSTWTWWMARACVRQVNHKGPMDIALLGSSQVNSPSWAADAHTTNTRLDCLDHREVLTLEKFLADKKATTRSVHAVNCAVQGGVASDYYMIERTLFLGANTPKLVVMCVSPRDFIDNKMAAASTTEAFRFFSRFSDPGKLTSLAYADKWTQLLADMDSAMNKLPLRRLGEIIEGQMALLKAPDKTSANAKGGHALEQAIYNGNQQVKLGDWVVPTDMKGTFVDNQKEYVARYANPSPKSYPIQMKFFDEELAELKAKGCAVLVVQMPTLPCNRALLPASFWSTYNADVSNRCKAHGVKLVEFTTSTDFDKPDYVDTVHLNDVGGIKFFDKLSSIISGDKELLGALR